MTSLLASTPLELSQAGRPKMQPGEVEMRSEGGVNLYHENGKTVLLPSCVVTLTNYRLLFIDRTCGISLDLERVMRVEDLTTVFRHSKRLRLLCNDNEIAELKFVEGKVS